MMNIKKRINFKTLREEGFNSLEIKDDEIVQVYTKNASLCIVDQEFLFTLLAKVEELKSIKGELVASFPHNESQIMKNFASRKNELLSNNFMESAIMGSAINSIKDEQDPKILLDQLRKEMEDKLAKIEKLIKEKK